MSTTASLPTRVIIQEGKNRIISTCTVYAGFLGQSNDLNESILPECRISPFLYFQFKIMPMIAIIAVIIPQLNEMMSLVEIVAVTSASVIDMSNV